MASQINSIGVSIVNFLLNEEKNAGILGLITESSSPQYKNKHYVTPAQLQEAIQYPFSCIKQVLYSELSLSLKLEEVYHKQVKCLELLDSIKNVRIQMQAQALKDAEKEDPPPPPDLSELDMHEKALAEQLQALRTAKQQIEAAQNQIQPLLTEYRQKWQDFREKTHRDAVAKIEKILDVKLKENEIEQLQRVESLQSVFTRFKELGIEPPMSYAEAEKAPASLLTLMCYLTAKEVINRVRIS